jgi:hypothetical protein
MLTKLQLPGMVGACVVLTGLLVLLLAIPLGRGTLYTGYLWFFVTSQVAGFACGAASRSTAAGLFALRVSGVLLLLTATIALSPRAGG